MPKTTEDEAHEPFLNSHDEAEEDREGSSGERLVAEWKPQEDVVEGLDDPFQPFDDLPDEDPNILTLRAVAVGLVCGTLVGGSNIYLGLKSGWTNGANIFGSVLGFALLKPCSRIFANVPLLSKDFGPRENNIVQTTASSAGGMTGIFVSAIPALYQLGLLSDSPWKDYWRLTTISLAGGFFGLFFATPMRRFFIIQVARELNLIFPSPTATAVAIKSMHTATGGADLAQKKLKLLVTAFAAAMVMRVVSDFLPGILWDWHVLAWATIIFGHSGFLMGGESWGWYLEPSPAFIGSGILVGLNVATSYLAGTVIAWGIAGPLLVAKEMAYGVPATEDSSWPNLMSYNSLSPENTSAIHPSPRFWLLWPGVACTVGVSFAELCCQWRVFALTVKVIIARLKGFGKPKWKAVKVQEEAYELEDVDAPSVGKTRLIKDPSAPHERVPTLLWTVGLLFTVIFTCLVMNLQYDMPIKETLLALLLAFFFSFVSIQATGAADLTPLTAVSKASQVVLGSVTRDWDVRDSQKLNLLGGALASVSASQASDLVSDFRIGFLLRTSPRLQWWAQAIGTAVAVFIAPALFALFASAYPCINDASALTCSFQAPSVSAWRAVALAVTDPTLPIPRSSLWFAVILTVFGCAMTVARYTLLTGKRAWMRTYHPNMMVIGLAFVIPATHYATAMFAGALIAHFWNRRNPLSFNTYGQAVAAGCMAGEGIGGVVNAVLQIVGLSGERLGTRFGCPAGLC